MDGGQTLDRAADSGLLDAVMSSTPYVAIGAAVGYATNVLYHKYQDHKEAEAAKKVEKDKAVHAEIKVDLTGYVTKDDLETSLNKMASKDDIKSILDAIETKMATVVQVSAQPLNKADVG